MIDQTSRRFTASGDSVADRLRQAITDGTFMPNERLVEERIAEMFETNRASVRLAMARLEQESLIVRERNRGARVRRVGDAEALEILEARAALEALVARHAAKNMSDADARDLEQIAARLEAYHERGEVVAYTGLNAALHERITAIARHGTAAKLLGLLDSQIVRFQYRALFQPGRTAESVAEHRRLIEALVARDPDAAERAMRDHLDCAVAALRRSIEGGPHPAHHVLTVPGGVS